MTWYCSTANRWDGFAPGGDAFLLVDIAIHPSLQSQGLGTALVRRLQREAQNAKLPIRSVVDRFNPGSLRFHQRLGFQMVREDQLQYYLEWRPEPLV
ncbi:MAG TPA: GNAT family N-acetyltransferase [Bryobacteraceae bacterium]|nr:GNAT family N-acetyltransferase [Bryobacteraceae bacterium]